MIVSFEAEGNLVEMLEYLGEIALAAVRVNYPLTQRMVVWLSEKMFGVSDCERDPRVIEMVKGTGYLHLGRGVIFNREWIDEISFCEGPVWALHLHPYVDEIEEEHRQRNGVIPPNLHRGGLALPLFGAVTQPLTGENLEAIRAVIRERVRPCKEYELCSYGLKHRLEEVLGFYISNGETIEAMILEKYRYRQTGMNCLFNGYWIPTAPL